MEEKILIQSEQGGSKQIFVKVFLTGILISVILFGSAAFKIAVLDGVPEYLDASWVRDGMAICTPILLVFSVVGLILQLWLGRCSLSITNRRVYGQAAFGKRVDLPLDSISAIGKSFLNGISISSASGVIRFFLIKNADKMYDIISRLLVERQKSSTSQSIIKQNFSNTSAEEIKKFKELLDAGIITQEEFDAKKKQLLGL